MTVIKKIGKPTKETKEALIEQLEKIETENTKAFEKAYWDLCQKHNRMHTLGQFIYSKGQMNASLAITAYNASLNPFNKK